MNGKGVSGCSKKRACVPSQTACLTTIIWMWLPALRLWKRCRNFYTEKGIDILKDAVSIPGVSFHYLLRGAIECSAELYTPSKKSL